MPHVRTLALLSALSFSALHVSVLPAQTQQPDTGATKSKKVDNDRVVLADQIHNPVLWQDPGDIANKDMLHGSGGVKHQPQAPFTFVGEARTGTNPKFDVRDANGKRWRVKLGSEARPEVVASRLLWAVGYFTNEDYNLQEATIDGLHLKRGADMVHNSAVTDARFERKPGDDKKIGVWRWKSNPFRTSREFNGLRVMMAVMNNWDLKDVNNAVYADAKHDRTVFLVSDIGATFASNDEHVRHDTDKGNLVSYQGSKFITKTEKMTVSFGTPMLPGGLVLRQGPILLGEMLRRSALDWIGQDIPRGDARWIGGLLGQLSHQQLEDAFHAGNFSPEDSDAFVKIVEARIAELQKL